MEKGINKAVKGVLEWGLLSKSKESNPQIHTAKKVIDSFFYVSWVAKMAIGGEPFQSIALAASAFWYAAYGIDCGRFFLGDEGMSLAAKTLEPATMNTTAQDRMSTLPSSLFL